MCSKFSPGPKKDPLINSAYIKLKQSLRSQKTKDKKTISGFLNVAGSNGTGASEEDVHYIPVEEEVYSEACKQERNEAAMGG